MQWCVLAVAVRETVSGKNIADKEEADRTEISLMELARLIRERRVRKSITEAGLGRIIKPRNPGRGVEYVRGIESGETPFPPLWALRIIARTLDISAKEIYAAQKADYEALAARSGSGECFPLPENSGLEVRGGKLVPADIDGE
jgi:hypothetical protein